MYGRRRPVLEPMSMAPRLNLCFAGQTAAVATMAAVLGGGPEWVDVSIMECFLASIDRRADSLVAYQYCGEKMTRMASVGVPGTPPQYNRAADGWFHLGATSRDRDRLAGVSGGEGSAAWGAARANPAPSAPVHAARCPVCDVEPLRVA